MSQGVSHLWTPSKTTPGELFKIEEAVKQTPWSGNVVIKQHRNAQIYYLCILL